MEEYQRKRLAEMKDFLQEDVGFLCRKRRKKMDAVYIGSGQGIRHDLETILKGFAMENGEGRLVISCLRSSYITGSFDFYIAFYTDEPFAEEEQDSACYSMKILLEGIGEDLKIIDKKLTGKFIRIMPTETEEIRRWYMEEICKEFKGVFRKILEDMKEEKHVDVFYGSYMDRLEAVGRV